MNQFKLKKIVIILIFSLLGIIALQVYWLAQSYSLAKNNFQLSVQDALWNAGNKLEEDKASSLLNNSQFDSLLHSVQPITSVIRQQHVNSVGNKMILVSKVRSQKGGVNAITNKEETIDSVIITNNKAVAHRIKIFENALKKKVVTFVSNTGSAKPLDTVFLANVIKEELRKKGIVYPFKLKYTKHLFNNLFVIDLSTINPLTQQSFVIVVFDQLGIWYFKVLFWQLLLSFLFTATIILVFYSTVHEIIKQKKLSDIKNDFINNVTHELKTPIATIQLTVDSLLPNAHNEKEKDYYKIIKAETKKLNTHVDQVLTHSLLYSNEFQLVYKKLNVNNVLKEAVQQLKLLIEHKKVEVHLDFRATITMVNADNYYLLEAFINIIDNAIKYSQANPELVIRTYDSEMQLVIEIEDNGIGIDKKFHQQIFTPFFRATKGNTHNIKGFGIGLSFVKKIIKLHGGKIEVDSALTKGSLFKIYLPHV